MWYNGRESDGDWSNFSLFEMFMDESNPLNIPPSKKLPGLNIKISYFIVADQAFPLKQSRNTDKKKRIF